MICLSKKRIYYKRNNFFVISFVQQSSRMLHILYCRHSCFNHFDSNKSSPASDRPAGDVTYPTVFA